MSSLTPEARKKIRNLIMDSEGFSEKIYRDTKGFWTIGFGFNLEAQGLPMSIAVEWLDLLLFNVESALVKYIHCWYDLNDARRAVLTSMAYNMGIGGLMQFHDMLKALEAKDYAATAKEMLDSRWSKDVPARASQLSKIMLSGEF